MKTMWPKSPILYIFDSLSLNKQLNQKFLKWEKNKKKKKIEPKTFPTII